jgi:hypothetical protein
MKRLFFPILTLLLVTLACSISINPGTQSSTEPPVVSGSPLPAGFIAAQQNQPVQLNFFNTSGGSLGSFSVPSLASAYQGNVFPAGGVSGGTPPPVIYYTYQGNNLISNTSGAETVLANTPEFYGMTGVPGQPLIAYGTANLTATGLDTSLFIGPPATATSAGPVLTYNTEPNGAIIPLHITTDGGSPTGVWFTKMMYGIGGDLVFSPSSGLFNLNLATSSVTEVVLPSGVYSPSLSPDATWMAYRDQNIGTVSALNIRQLTTGETHIFALLADSDRGAGDGVFSYDLQHVAWMEGHGWMMAEVPDFRSTVRLGTISGGILGDYPAASFNAVAGFSVTGVTPVGWLDNQNVLLQASGGDLGQNCVIKLGLDGSKVLLANGSFTGFLYP